MRLRPYLRRVAAVLVAVLVSLTLLDGSASASEVVTALGLG